MALAGGDGVERIQFADLLRRCGEGNSDCPKLRLVAQSYDFSQAESKSAFPSMSIKDCRQISYCRTGLYCFASGGESGLHSNNHMSPTYWPQSVNITRLLYHSNDPVSHAPTRGQKANTLKHARLFVHVPAIGKYCIVGKDLPEADVALVQGAVDLINGALMGILTLEITDTAETTDPTN